MGASFVGAPICISMKQALRLLVGVGLVCVCGLASAARSVINLTEFPAISVADGRSTVTISAEVRDDAGHLIADGTNVLFSTTIGSFRENMVSTKNGVARAVLVAPGTAGTARITATAIGVDAIPANADFEFVADKSLLSTAQEYVQILAADYLQFAGDTKVIGAASPNRGVLVTYHDLKLIADDIQLNTQTMELRARNAQLSYGHWTKDFTEVYLRLTARKGMGITSFASTRWNIVYPRGRWFAFGYLESDGRIGPAKDDLRIGVVEVRPGMVRPLSTSVNSAAFKFLDLSDAPSTVSAKKAVVFPHREVQFQRAEIFVAGSKVLRVPLYAVSLRGTTSPLVTDQMVSIDSNRLAVSYPYYLTLEPGLTTLLRFRTGTQGDGGLNTMRGVFLDYEADWNRGDEMQGAFEYDGLGRDDYTVSVRQYWRVDDRTDFSGQVAVPQGQNIYGSVSAGHQFNGFQVNGNASSTHSLSGLAFSRTDYSLTAEKDPTKVGKLPLNLYLGVVAQQSTATTSSYDGSQSYYGARLRGQTTPINFDRSTGLSEGFSVSKLVGLKANDGVAISSTTAITRQLAPGISLVGTYDYLRDGFNELIMGRHRASLQASAVQGRTNLSINASKSLDIDRRSIFGDMSYRLGKFWRAEYGYSFDHYMTETYSEHTYLLCYRIGWREVGLTYSSRTNRIGLALLAASY